jgi:hypothetical protein
VFANKQATYHHSNRWFESITYHHLSRRETQHKSPMFTGLWRLSAVLNNCAIVLFPSFASFSKRMFTKHTESNQFALALVSPWPLGFGLAMASKRSAKQWLLTQLNCYG